MFKKYIMQLQIKFKVSLNHFKIGAMITNKLKNN